jgi:signal peptidase II
MILSARTGGFCLSIVILLIDFVRKRYVLANIGQFSAGIPIIDGFVSFTYVRNAGAAFGMFQGARWPFVVVSTSAVFGLIWILVRGHATGMRGHAYSLILAGAMGNLIDRLFYDGRVVDFILLSWDGHHFPVFNVADMAVSVGACLLILTMLRPEPSAVEAATDAGLDP